MIYTLYSDGSCRPNPGKGAYACIILDACNEIIDVVSGIQLETTNNRMELLGVIKGLEAVPDGSEVVVNTDSKYIVDTINKGFARNKNQDLWQRLDIQLDLKSVVLNWIKGHAQNSYNNLVDSIVHKLAGSDYV